MDRTEMSTPFASRDWDNPLFFRSRARWVSPLFIEIQHLQIRKIKLILVVEPLLTVGQAHSFANSWTSVQ